MRDGFVKVAAATLNTKVADVEHNKWEIDQGSTSKNQKREGRGTVFGRQSFHGFEKACSVCRWKTGDSYVERI